MTRSPAWSRRPDSALMDDRTNTRKEFGIERQNTCGQAIPKENSESRSRPTNTAQIDARRLSSASQDPHNLKLGLKGNKLTIETGKDEVTYAHTVDSPKEVLTGQDANGIMLAVQIRDAAGIPTLIKLQA